MKQIKQVKPEASGMLVLTQSEYELLCKESTTEDNKDKPKESYKQLSLEDIGFEI